MMSKICNLEPKQMMIVNLHTHYPLPSGTIGLRNCSVPMIFRPEAGVFYSVGIHPRDAGKASAGELPFPKALAGHPQVLAVGECGLDRSIDVPLDVQMSVFLEQVEIAEQLQVPLIIHAVRSYSDMLYVKKRRRMDIPWILHGYSGNFETTVRLVRMGFFFSFGPALKFGREKMDRAFRAVPPDRLFLETDDLETGLESLYQHAGGMLDVDVEALERQVWGNFQKVFGSSYKGTVCVAKPEHRHTPDCHMGLPGS